MIGTVSAVVLAMITYVNAIQGDDMSDSDYAAYVTAHNKIRQQYGSAAVRGCVNGAIDARVVGGDPIGGCVYGAATNIAQKFELPKFRIEMPKNFDHNQRNRDDYFHGSAFENRNRPDNVPNFGNAMNNWNAGPQWAPPRF